MKIRVLTFNLGACANLSQEEWQKHVDKSWRHLVAQEEDAIWFVTTQEDRVTSHLVNSLRNVFERQGRSCFADHCGRISGFTVHVLLAFPSTFSVRVNSSEKLVHSWQRTKGSVIVSVDVENTRLVFIGSHLPFCLKKHDSCKTRISESMRVIRLVYSGIGDMMTDRAAMVWAGDLNYRLDVRGDQLQRLLSESTRGIMDASRIDTYAPTCKRKTFPKALTPACKRAMLDPDLSPHRLARFYDPTRTPSYCDRVLVGTTGELSLETKVVRPWLQPPVHISDHNALVAHLFLKGLS